MDTTMLFTTESPMTNEERLEQYEQRKQASFPSPRDKVCPGCGRQHWDYGVYCGGCQNSLDMERRGYETY